MISLTPSPFYKQHKSAMDFVEIYVITIVIPFVTFAVVIMATAVTVLKLKRSEEFRNRASSKVNPSSSVNSTNTARV